MSVEFRNLILIVCLYIAYTRSRVPKTGFVYATDSVPSFVIDSFTCMPYLREEVAHLGSDLDSIGFWHSVCLVSRRDTQVVLDYDTSSDSRFRFLVHPFSCRNFTSQDKQL